jgi:predicted ester cyclase
MSAEENKAKLRRIYDECFNQGNLATADELISPDFQDISPGIPAGVPTTGPDSLKAAVRMFRAAFPDLRVTADEVIAEGDAVSGRATWTGTQRGDLMGISATGKRVSWSSIEIVHVRDGRFVSHYGIQDGMSLMQQLGVMPAAAQAGG